MIVLADVVLLVVENVVQFLLIVLLFVELIPFMDDAVMIVEFLKLGIGYFKCPFDTINRQAVTHIISIFQYYISTVG